jgi:hypothetical protein
MHAGIRFRIIAGAVRCTTGALMPRLSEDEMVEILEDLARNSPSATARIQAIKVLRGMSDDDEQPSAEGFEALDELAPRRNYRTKTA